MCFRALAGGVWGALQCCVQDQSVPTTSAQYLGLSSVIYRLFVLMNIDRLINGGNLWCFSTTCSLNISSQSQVHHRWPLFKFPVFFKSVLRGRQYNHPVALVCSSHLLFSLDIFSKDTSLSKVPPSLLYQNTQNPASGPPKSVFHSAVMVTLVLNELLLTSHDPSSSGSFCVMPDLLPNWPISQSVFSQCLLVRDVWFMLFRVFFVCLFCVLFFFLWGTF